MKLLKTKDVAEMMNVSIDTFRKSIKHQPNFPKTFKTHPNARPAWLDADIEAYMQAQSSRAAMSLADSR